MKTLADRASYKLWRLEAGTLCEEAKRRTGLEDFGEPAVGPVLSVLTQSLEEEANLKPIGRLLMRIHLRGLLETRLRLVDVWKKREAETAGEKIERPVFIVGMPRSGSTFLHELLAQDPRHRAPRVWEVMFPLGEPGDETRRVRKAEFCLWWFRKLAPRADEVYPMRAQTPHECVAIHSHTFLSEEFVSSAHVPGYEAMLRSTNLRPAYEWQTRFLKHMQLSAPGRRWIVKSPDHVHGLEQLFALFPDAHIIQTHRNPLEVLESSADLTRVLRALYARPGSRDEIRAREARVLAEGTERFIKFRDEHPELSCRFIDVKYKDLAADPMAAVREIYQRLECRLTEEAAARIAALAAKRSRYPGRRASEEVKGTQVKHVTEAGKFESYCLRFGLPFGEAEF